MHSKDKATPRPWGVSHRHIYKNDWAQEHGQWIDHTLATVDEGPTTEEAVANAALIVRAVNAYDTLQADNARLVAAVKFTLKELQECRGNVTFLWARTREIERHLEAALRGERVTR